MDTTEVQMVAAVVRRDNDVLLVREGGTAWRLPGDVVSRDELWHEALHRIVREQTGIEAEPLLRLAYLVQAQDGLGTEESDELDSVGSASLLAMFETQAPSGAPV